MTPSELKYHVEATGSHYFSRETMKFFGDTMANYGACDAGDCWELFRRKPVKMGLKESAFFDKVTFKRVLKQKESVA